MGIEIKNIKAVDHLEIPLDGNGGVVVMRGCQGAGKSTAIEATRALLGGSTSELEVSDNQESGFVKLGDAKITVTKARSTRQRRELKVVSIEGKVDIWDIIEPGIDNDLRADAARLRALVKLVGVEPDPVPYHSLCGGPENFSKLGVDLDTGCPVELARRVKKALVSRSGRHKDSLASTQDEMMQLESQIDGVDLDGEADIEKLEAAHREAIHYYAEVGQALKSHQETLSRVQEARAKISEPQRSLDQVKVLLSTTVERITQLENHLQEAKELRQQLVAEEEMCKKWSQFQAELASISECSFTQEHLSEAETAVKLAGKEVERGRQRREAIQSRERLRKLTGEAEKFENASKQLQSLSERVEQTLWAQLPEMPLRIEPSGRIVISTDRSSSEPFSQLSIGERIVVVLPLAAQLLGQQGGGVMTLRQEAWEGLQPANQAALGNFARQCGVHIITAQATDSSSIEISQIPEPAVGEPHQPPPDFVVEDGSVVDHQDGQ